MVEAKAGGHLAEDNVRCRTRYVELGSFLRDSTQDGVSHKVEDNYEEVEDNDAIHPLT